MYVSLPYSRSAIKMAFEVQTFEHFCRTSYFLLQVSTIIDYMHLKIPIIAYTAEARIAAIKNSNGK